MTHDLTPWLMVGIWWIAYSSADSISRGIGDHNHSTTIFSAMGTGWVDLTALQLITGSVISMVIIVGTGKPIRSSPVFEHKKIICIAAFGHVLGSLAANAAYTVVTSTVQLSILACQPLLTFVLTWAMSSNSVSESRPNLFQLVILVVGVVVLELRDTLFNITGLVTAVVSTIAFTTRNVVLKETLCVWNDSIETFMSVSFVSAVLVFPVWLAKAVITQTIFTSDLWKVTLTLIFHPAYSLASLQVLGLFGPVTHAMVAILIRLVFCVESLAIFKMLSSNFTCCMVLGCLYTTVGIILVARHASMERSGLVILVILALSCLALYPMSSDIPPKQSSMGNFTIIPINMLYPSENESVSCSDVQCTDHGTILTAWVYQRHIPKNVIANIRDLADNNHRMNVHVYCGTTQCMNAVAELHKSNIEVKFAVISKIVKGTSLAEWLSHHPLYKLLAGKEFENHLQEVTILGLMWQYGGFYINPMVKVGKLTVPKCSFIWVSKEIALPESSLPSVLDVLYFTKKHAIIEIMARTFAREYRTNVRKGLNFKFDFINTVWNKVQGCFSTFAHIPLERVTLKGRTAEDSHYGTLTHSIQFPVTQQSLDDQIENFAGLQFLPFVDTHIERESFQGANSVTVFVNGQWELSSVSAGNNTNPIMLSVELNNKTGSRKTSYLRSKEPIGCRDVETLKYLRANGVKTFSPSSLMLLMSSPTVNVPRRRGNIFLVGVEDEHIQLLPPDIQNKSIRMNPKMEMLSLSQDAYRVIEEYASAELVITGSIQHALLCVALRTPVLFFRSASSSHYSELAEIFHESTLDLDASSEEQAKAWLSNYSWNDPPRNWSIALIMRLKATAWNVIRKNQDLHDAARKFGVIPMKLPVSQEKDDLIFHLIFTTSQKSTIDIFGGPILSGEFNWRHWRVVESIFHHHPTAHVIMHTNTLEQSLFDVLTEVGYSIEVQNYDLKEILIGSPAEDFIVQLDMARGGSYWYANEADLLRLLFLYKTGGIYIDMDVTVVKRLDSLGSNIVGWEDKQESSLNNAFLKFEKGNPYLEACLKLYAPTYDNNAWGKSGPILLTNVYGNLDKDDRVDVNVVGYKCFYMIHWSAMLKQCFIDTEGEVFDANLKVLKTEAYAFHCNAKISGHMGLGKDKLKKGTICSYIKNAFCVLCDQFY